ncbi:hypothetical protein GobsT_10380 [Gemmata obscuriglobus]|nr:hypothetical protein GobsT_10380 [Gemmata obscuriglobus]VTS01185.1 Uncharacterized protein OS=Stigmatella aurantiaca (strain DW4/3-1) GN=STIAU_4175 PE=4 SV=1 [Gemmata obscuriglobus UQM 2246]
MIDKPLPGCIHDGAENRVGGVVPVRWAVTAVRNANTLRFCRQHEAITVRTRSTNRLPCSLSVPELVSRQHTAWRTSRPAALLVGSTPAIRANVHSDASTANNSAHVAAPNG